MGNKNKGFSYSVNLYQENPAAVKPLFNLNN